LLWSQLDKKSILVDNLIRSAYFHYSVSHSIDEEVMPMDHCKSISTLAHLLRMS